MLASHKSLDDESVTLTKIMCAATTEVTVIMRVAQTA